MEKLTNSNYEELKKTYIQGWKTWNVNSVLSHVYMPDGMALNLCFREYASGGYLRESLIGRFLEEHGRTPKENIIPQYHTLDDSYTWVTLEWCNLQFEIESAAEKDEIYLLITPVKFQPKPAMAVLESGFLWDRTGSLIKKGNTLEITSEQTKKTVRMAGNPAKEDKNIPSMTQYLAAQTDGVTAFYTGPERTLEEIQRIVTAKKEEADCRYEKRGQDAQMLRALECAVSWDTIYDANHNRVISPVSRLWSIGSGGYVLFCWDNYFASFMASFGSRELAYSNMIEITNERTEDGFVPNFSYGTGQKSRDRSQPPVGAAMLAELYRKYREKWIVELLFPALFQWNTWFWENRCTEKGTFCWGSNPISAEYGNRWETDGVMSTYGGALESGLDNSPMYDDIPFDGEKHIMELEDVGLTGLYILDCGALLELAELLEKEEETRELRQRKEKAEAGLETLWVEEKGFYYNRRLDTGAYSMRISPTNFYALFSEHISRERAGKILAHYYNPEEFYGEWMLPSISHNDSAFKDQDYWRGRVWAPLNFLVYLAFSRQGLDEARKDLAEKSAHIFLKEWEEHRHVHENYNGITGEGCDAHNSDKFYHWGALLAAVSMMENHREKILEKNDRDD